MARARKKNAKRSAKRSAKKRSSKRRVVSAQFDELREQIKNSRMSPLTAAVFAGVQAYVRAMAHTDEQPDAELRWSLTTFDKDGGQVEDLNRPITESLDHAIRKAEQDKRVVRAEVTGRDGTLSIEFYELRDGILCRV